MRKEGFSAEKYIEEQSKYILERIHSGEGRLYLEFGGKLVEDKHAMRVLPGFDENAKNVMDGSNFVLEITLVDGSTISAHGSNRFPAYYSEVSSSIRTLCGELMQLYADSEGKEDVL